MSPAGSLLMAPAGGIPKVKGGAGRLDARDPASSTTAGAPFSTDPMSPRSRRTRVELRSASPTAGAAPGRPRSPRSCPATGCASSSATLAGRRGSRPRRRGESTRDREHQKIPRERRRGTRRRRGRRWAQDRSAPNTGSAPSTLGRTYDVTPRRFGRAVAAARRAGFERAWGGADALPPTAAQSSRWPARSPSCGCYHSARGGCPHALVVAAAPSDLEMATQKGPPSLRQHISFLALPSERPRAVGQGLPGPCAQPASRPSAPRSGGGAKRRALTPASTRSC